MSYALYLLFVVVGANDAIASSLLSWSATMFATVALLFTFNTWREQKASDVLSSLCKEYYLNLNTLNKEIKDFYKQFSGHFPLIEVDIPSMKYFLKVNENLEDFSAKLQIIFKHSKKKELLDQINEINNLISLNDDVRYAVVTKKNSQIEHFNSVTEKIENFDKCFKSFKKSVDKILIDFTFYKENQSVRITFCRSFSE